MLLSYSLAQTVLVNRGNRIPQRLRHFFGDKVLLCVCVPDNDLKLIVHRAVLVLRIPCILLRLYRLPPCLASSDNFNPASFPTVTVMNLVLIIILWMFIQVI